MEYNVSSFPPLGLRIKRYLLTTLSGESCIGKLLISFETYGFSFSNCNSQWPFVNVSIYLFNAITYKKLLYQNTIGRYERVDGWYKDKQKNQAIFFLDELV